MEKSNAFRRHYKVEVGKDNEEVVLVFVRLEKLIGDLLSRHNRSFVVEADCIVVPRDLHDGHVAVIADVFDCKVLGIGGERKK